MTLVFRNATVLTMDDAHTVHHGGDVLVSGERIEAVGPHLEVPEGTLYPVLHKLEKEGLVRSHWEKVSGRRRRVYAASPKSQTALRDRVESWERLSRAIDAGYDCRK